MKITINESGQAKPADNFFKTHFWWIIFVLYLLLCMANILHRDSTDRGLHKSNLGLYIDNATGCHYLKGGIGSQIIPRVDKNGLHICGGYEYERKKLND